MQILWKTTILNTKQSTFFFPFFFFLSKWSLVNALAQVPVTLRAFSMLSGETTCTENWSLLGKKRLFLVEISQTPFHLTHLPVANTAVPGGLLTRCRAYKLEQRWRSSIHSAMCSCHLEQSLLHEHPTRFPASARAHRFNCRHVQNSLEWFSSPQLVNKVYRT